MNFSMMSALLIIVYSLRILHTTQLVTPLNWRMHSSVRGVSFVSCAVLAYTQNSRSFPGKEKDGRKYKNKKTLFEANNIDKANNKRECVKKGVRE